MLTWELCGVRIENPLPESITDQNLSENFAAFFMNKIKNIRDNLVNLSLFKYVLDQSI